MIREIELGTAFSTQICQVVRLPRVNGQTIQRSDASTVLFLCVHLIALFGLEMYRLQRILLLYMVAISYNLVCGICHSFPHILDCQLRSHA